MAELRRFISRWSARIAARAGLLASGATSKAGDFDLVCVISLLGLTLSAAALRALGLPGLDRELPTITKPILEIGASLAVIYVIAATSRSGEE
jgi:hypothetical protein